MADQVKVLVAFGAVKASNLEFWGLDSWPGLSKLGFHPKVIFGFCT